MRPEFLALVRARLLERGWDQSKLAKETGIHKGAISRLVAGKQRASRSLSDIARVLDLPDPFAAIDDEAEARWVKVGRGLREADPARFDALLAYAEQNLARVLRVAELRSGADALDKEIAKGDAEMFSDRATSARGDAPRPGHPSADPPRSPAPRRQPR